MAEDEKSGMYEAGVTLAEAFLRANDLRFPSWRIDPTLKERGHYDPRDESVAVNLTNCDLPLRSPAYRWSHPSGRHDVSPIGVIAHETGHHLHHLLGFSGVPARWYRGCVSDYEPNWIESAAETVRVFITNPGLLREALPRRYGVLTGKWGLSPVLTLEWRKLLTDLEAPDGVVEEAESWIREQQKI